MRLTLPHASFLAVLPALLLLPAAATAQVAANANSGYVTEELRSRVAETLSKESRAEDLRARDLVASLGLKPGMAVADVGTGAGIMLPLLSEAVGGGGKVFAEDIFPDFLAKARARATAAGLKNVHFVQGSETDPKLPAGAVDLVLTVDVYHHFDYPEKMLPAIAKSLKRGGRFVVVDMHKSAEAMPGGRALEHIRLPADEVVKEVESNGFRLVERREHVPKKLWVGIFEPR